MLRRVSRNPHEIGTLVLPFEGRPRRVRTFVPPHVEAAPPLLVLFDGQNVLDDHGSYAGGWHAHQAIVKLPKTVRRPVLVAIDHGNQGRMRELWHDLDAFLAFVRGEVLPHVEQRIGVRFDPHTRVVGGALMGGLASLAAIARHPEWFAGALAMSPSAWFAPDAIQSELARAPISRSARLYVDVGHRESEAMVRESARVAHLLTHRVGAERVMWRPDRRGKHREVDWRRRLPKALRFLFRKPGI